MKSRYLLYSLLVCSISYGQEADRFDEYNFNSRYLEHLVKSGVDSVRKKHHCEPLINDSILYVASLHHAHYLVRSKQLSHIEIDSVSTRTPQDRVDFFGAVNYRAGENILFTPYNAIVEGKNKTRFDTHTYHGIADAMVSAWVHSPGHFKNIITAEYQLTGLSVAMDSITGRIYACQKFAVADYRYYFSENKAMFPFSNFTLPQPVTSFDGINRQLDKDFKYHFDLKYNKPEACFHCEKVVTNYSGLTLRVENEKFILRVENADYVKQLLHKRLDGFAVELVGFTDYMCGNPAYYTKPSRRNGQRRLNGRILRPVYNHDLYKGFKWRSKKEGVKFVSYIFQTDSVAFFKRFGQFKLDRYKFEYFEMSLGRVPRDFNGYWNHNLVYIQNNQICHIDYLTGYCGEVIREYQPAEFIPSPAEDNCVINPEERFLHFTIPFEQGKSDFTTEDIVPFIRSISSLSYDLDSVQIHAYSSIEGDSVLNRNLQIKRSFNIAAVLKQNQNLEVPVRITTSADWKGFYESVAKHQKWKYLATKNQTEVLNELRKTGIDEIEPILKTGRRGEIDLFCTIQVNQQNLEYLLSRELKQIHNQIDSLTRARRSILEALMRFNLLYECIHSKVVQGKLSPDFLVAVKMPKRYNDNHPLTQNFIMYGDEFTEAFSKNPDWLKNHKEDQKFIETICTEPTHIQPAFLYKMIYDAIIQYQEKKETTDLKKLQHLLNEIGKLKNYYQTDSVAQLNIDRLNFNLNILLLNAVFASKPVKYSTNAMASLAQLNQFYDKYQLMNSKIALKLSKTAVYFDQIHTAIELITPYAVEDSILAYMIPMQYQHITTEGSTAWYEYLIELSEKMNRNTWCDLFLGNCKIPFQAFDYEPLRNVFCKQCMEHNDFLINLLGK